MRQKKRETGIKRAHFMGWFWQQDKSGECYYTQVWLHSIHGLESSSEITSQTDLVLLLIIIIILVSRATRWFVLSFFFNSKDKKQLTLWWRVVIRVRVTLTAVLHQKTGTVPGHADDAIRLMQQNVGQHATMAVHHYYLSICSAK